MIVCWRMPRHYRLLFAAFLLLFVAVLFCRKLVWTQFLISDYWKKKGGFGSCFFLALCFLHSVLFSRQAKKLRDHYNLYETLLKCVLTCRVFVSKNNVFAIQQSVDVEGEVRHWREPVAFALYDSSQLISIRNSQTRIIIQHLTTARHGLSCLPSRFKLQSLKFNFWWSLPLFHIVSFFHSFLFVLSLVSGV